MLLFTLPVLAQLQEPSPGARKAKGSPPQTKTQTTQQQTPADQRGTESAPVVIKVLPTPKTEQEAAQEKAERDDIHEANWWMVRLTGVIGLIGFLQLIVFGLQARRLRQTVITMRQIAQNQSNEMQASIAQATRAATAMEKVAESVARTAQASNESIATTKDFWSRQMRAYLSILPGTLIEQNQQTNTVFEFQPWIFNTGNTRAHDVIYNACVEMLPFPLLEDFTYPLPSMAPSPSVSVIGAQQRIFMVTGMNRMLTTNELSEIKNPGGRRLFVYGTVTYKDIFSRDWYTNFCYYIIWGSAGIPVWMITHRHNDCS